MTNNYRSTGSAVVSQRNPSWLRSRMIMAASLTVLVLIGMWGLAEANTGYESAPPELAPLPFNDLVDINGTKLTDAAGIGEGQWTLVMIWATHCHICKEQKPLISAFHNAHKNTDARVFGIALDGESKLDAVKKYMDKNNVAFPTFVGDFGSVAADYQQLTTSNLRGTPTYLLFDPSGELKGNNPGQISVEAIESFIARHTQ